MNHDHQFTDIWKDKAQIILNHACHEFRISSTNIAPCIEMENRLVSGSSRAFLCLRSYYSLLGFYVSQILIQF